MQCSHKKTKPKLTAWAYVNSNNGKTVQAYTRGITMTENQIKADAINNLVSTMIGAFDAGYTDRNHLTLSELHRIAQLHVKDNYGIELPNIIEQWGESMAKQCGLGSNYPERFDKLEKLLWLAIAKLDKEEHKQLIDDAIKLLNEDV